MLREKVRIEIYEGNPFTGCCGPGVFSENSSELMKMLDSFVIVLQCLSEMLVFLE